MTKAITRHASNVGTFTDHQSVQLQRLLDGSIDQVWDYLTRPALLARWLAGGKTDARLGGQIELDFDLIDCPGREEIHGLLHGVITEFAPPCRLAYTWNEGHQKAATQPDSLVIFQLEAAPGGQTLLSLTHTRLLRQDLSPVGAGWHIHLDVLADRIAKREPPHFMEAYCAVEPAYNRLIEAEAV